MRAVVQEGIGDPSVLKLRQVEEPVLERGGVLIRTAAVGVNFHDVEIRRRGDRGLSLPVVPGTDVAGVVERVADDVTEFAPGDRVLALLQNGGYAEQAVSHTALTVRIPDGIDDEVAAAIPVAGLTAWFLCLEQVGPTTSQVVVHSAAGGVGSWLGALLAPTPVRTIGIVSTAAKREVALRCGYDAVIDRSLYPDAVDAVKIATGRRGADVVFDAVGGPSFGDSFRMLRPEGTVVLYGRAGGPPATAELSEVLLDARRNIGLRTFFLSRTLLGHMGDVRGAFERLLALVAGGALRMPIISMPLKEAGKAQELLESRSTVGKIVLRP